MTASFQTPVILILFNRPDRVRRLLDVLREVRPAHILAIADGPRPAHPSDVAACRAAREALASIDWPCTLEREFSDGNLGSSTRTATGLDWAFRHVPQAIVFEDDPLPDPSFMYWVEDMLDRFPADPDVLMVSGYNRLGRWPIGQSEAPAADHIRSRHGSLWGWATTSAAWHFIQTTAVSGDPGDAFDDLVAFGLDPLLATHLTPTLEAFRRGRNVAFDRLFGIRVAARRGPKRSREPLPGLGAPAAFRFVNSLGELAGPFAISLEGSPRHGDDEIKAAEDLIAASSAVVARGEGGVFHYRNIFPDDPHLRQWAGLVARHNGDHTTAAAEFAAAAQSGWAPCRT